MVVPLYLDIEGLLCQMHRVFVEAQPHVCVHKSEPKKSQLVSICSFLTQTVWFYLNLSFSLFLYNLSISLSPHAQT